MSKDPSNGFNETNEQGVEEPDPIETQFNVYYSYGVYSILPAGPDYNKNSIEINEHYYTDPINEPSNKIVLDYELAELVAKAILKQCSLIRKNIKKSNATNQTSLPIS
jgi:protein-tyrosine phosphatase